MVKDNKQDKSRFKLSGLSIRKKWLFLVIVVLVVAAVGYLMISKINNKDDASKDAPIVKGTLTVKDLEKPDVELIPSTSDASVDNLNKELNATIDKQIASKQNPIDTVKKLSGVLTNTTNQKRQDQLTNFLEDFFAKHEDSLWFDREGSKPDQAQVNYWKSELYAYLVYNFKSMMESQFNDSDGQQLDTTDKQLEYIDLYLKLANDPKSYKVASQQERRLLNDYEYKEASAFLELKNRLSTSNAL